MIKTLILSGFGTNCERETRYACEKAGAEVGAGPVEVRHISEIYGAGLPLDDYRLLVLIGGFMDGDDLGSGRACANRFRYRPLPLGSINSADGAAGGGVFLDRLRDYIADGRLLLAVCNGFQVAVKLGLLPGEALSGPVATGPYHPPASTDPDHPQQSVTLTTNAQGRFEDRWVSLRGDPASPCIFTRGVEHLDLPVRHGEGRMAGRDSAHLAALVERHLTPLRYSLEDGTPTERYPANPNGSPYGIASLCNARGTVLGLMPHPEAYNHYTNHPQWMRRPAPPSEDGAGLAIFRNAYRHLAG